MSDLLGRWEWVNTILSSSLGFFAGAGFYHRLFTRKVEKIEELTGKRMTIIDTRQNGIEDMIDEHERDIQVMKSHRPDDEKRWDRMEQRQERILEILIDRREQLSREERSER